MPPRTTAQPVYVASPSPTGLIARMGTLLVAGAVATGIGIAIAPSTTTPAATVNGVAIPRSVVDGIVKDGCADSSGRRETATECGRQALTSAVYQELVKSLASSLHVTVSDATIKASLTQIAATQGGLDALYASAQKAGLSTDRIYTYVRAKVLPGQVQLALTAAKPPSDANVQTYYTDHPSDFTVIRLAVIVTNAQAVSDEVARKVAAHPEDFTQLVQTYTTDATTKATQGHLKPITLTTWSSTVGPKLKVATPTAGQVLGPLADGGQFELYRVIAVTHTTFAEGAPLIKSLLEKDGSPYAVALLDAALSLQAHQVGVTIDHRYGTWDYATSTVVAKG